MNNRKRHAFAINEIEDQCSTLDALIVIMMIEHISQGSFHKRVINNQMIKIVKNRKKIKIGHKHQYRKTR